jgi:hypothetical protein
MRIAFRNSGLAGSTPAARGVTTQRPFLIATSNLLPLRKPGFSSQQLEAANFRRAEAVSASIRRTLRGKGTTPNLILSFAKPI